MKYTEAKIITKTTSILHVVDHIWPLKGKGFNGLHVEYNLQVIPAQVNQTKFNKRPEQNGR